MFVMTSSSTTPARASKRQGGPESEQPKPKRGRPVPALASVTPVLDLYVLSCSTSLNVLQVALAKDLEVYQQDHNFTVHILARYPGTVQYVQSLRAKLMNTCIVLKQQCVTGWSHLQFSSILTLIGDCCWAVDLYHQQPNVFQSSNGTGLPAGCW